MSTYNEFIKNFKRVRSYMRNFYIYNFKSREAFQSKSARSYDDERRLLESWQGNHMSFVRPPPSGKSVFISIDSCTDSRPLDKSPMVYKSTEETVEYIWPAAEITCRIKHICNFKAAE